MTATKTNTTKAAPTKAAPAKATKAAPTKAAPAKATKAAKAAPAAPAPLAPWASPRAWASPHAMAVLAPAPAPAEEAAPAPAPMPKCATARKQVAKPQAKMLRKIASIGKHPGKALRIKRFADYAVGMTLQHCKETDGLDHLDVLFYVDHGLMTLAEPTEKEVEAAVAAWTKAKEATAKAA